MFSTPGVKQLPFAKSLSRALALWDCFDHTGAWRLIEPFLTPVAQRYDGVVPNLKVLTTAGPRREPARLFDLWLNAERRAAQGRFDDAVARWYRLMEWTAQWQIEIHLGAETADFPQDQMPEGMAIAPDAQGKIRVPLLKSWKIVAARIDGPCRVFFRDHRATLVDKLRVRNHSILAHGFRPVAEDEWQSIRHWTQDNFLPLLRDLAKNTGLTKEMGQLPNRPPELD